MDSDSKNEIVELEPFMYQVSGRSSMLLLDERTICKPLISQELKFYENSPDHLKSFIPEYKGIIEVTFNIDEKGYLILTTSNPLDETFNLKSEKTDSTQEKLKNKVKHRIRVCNSGSIQIESDSPDEQKQTFEEGSQISVLNPWVLHCHQQQINKLINGPPALNQKYMLLENLTWHYEFPCVLDIKMGTRQYDDDASVAKKQSFIAKAEATTTSLIGVRIFGMQVYNHDCGHFICHNKYYGRNLSIDGFNQALLHFLHDGQELRIDVILALLNKLWKLLEIVKTLDTFRFYTSSLLIIYDGKKHISQNQCDCTNSHYSPQSKDGYNHLAYDNGNINSPDSKMLIENAANVQEDKSDTTSLPQTVVDVRLIDFAHSTQSALGSQNLNAGPDEGCIFGLENLIAQLQKIYQKVRHP